jgi:hypothetical protein
MKNLILLLLVLSPFLAFTQIVKLEYKGGMDRFRKLIVSTTDGNNDEWNKNNEIDKYYNIKFTIDKDNRLGKDILIESSADIDSMPSIYALMESTKDKWINHTGHDLEVVLPLYYYYEDGTPRKRINDKYHFSYWPKKDILILDLLITKRYPTQR